MANAALQSKHSNRSATKTHRYWSVNLRSSILLLNTVNHRTIIPKPFLNFLVTQKIQITEFNLLSGTISNQDRRASKSPKQANISVVDGWNQLAHPSKQVATAYEIPTSTDRIIPAWLACLCTKENSQYQSVHQSTYHSASIHRYSNQHINKIYPPVSF